MSDIELIIKTLRDESNNISSNPRCYSDDQDARMLRRLANRLQSALNAGKPAVPPDEPDREQEERK